MSHDKPIPISTTTHSGFAAPTPQNTPLNTAPINSGLSKPTVPDIAEEDDDKAAGSDEDDDDGANVEADQARISATMLGMVQGKLAGLLGKSSGYLESLPLAVRKRIEGLKGVHSEYAKLEVAYKKEVLELDRKYAGLYQPVFERRHAILTGVAEPTADEVKVGEAVTLKDNPEALPLSSETADDDEKDVKGIPEFWLTALRNHPDISSVITERDEGAIRALTDIRLEYLTESAGFILTFHFSPNEYFTNEVLSKTYYYQQELDYMGDFMYSRAEGTKIEWKADKDLTSTVEVRKQRNKNTNRTRIVRKSKKTPSFFDFFSPPTPPADDALENGDMDEEELGELEFRLEMDYQIGEDLKERVIPRAIDYFTGKAMEYEDDNDEDEMESDEDGDGFGVPSDDDDDDDDAPPRKKKGGKGAGGGSKGGDGECKNQ